MTPARRKTYLKALGVESWVPRDAAVEALADVAVDSRVALAPSPQPPSPLGVRESIPIMAKSAVVPAKPVETRPAEPLPTDWAGLRAAVKNCERCKLCATRTNTVFGVGPENATLMVVGEGPGADEDAQGEPFVGRAGKLLDEMLAAIGRSRRDSVFIANVVKCRPPGNRDPEVDEVEACRPFLEQQIRLVKPQLILGLGRIAAQRLLATDQPLTKLRGPIHAYGSERTPLFITYHPAYLLRSPREKAKSWDDLKKVWRFLKAGA